jgi:hypothetical protein
MEAKDAGSMSVHSKQWSDLERQMRSICLDHQRCHQELEIDDKPSDKIFLQLRIHTGFAFHLLITIMLADANLSLQRPADQRKRHSSSLSFSHKSAKWNT